VKDKVQLYKLFPECKSPTLKDAMYVVDGGCGYYLFACKMSDTEEIVKLKKFQKPKKLPQKPKGSNYCARRDERFCEEKGKGVQAEFLLRRALETGAIPPKPSTTQKKPESDLCSPMIQPFALKETAGETHESIPSLLQALAT